MVSCWFKIGYKAPQGRSSSIRTIDGQFFKVELLKGVVLEQKMVRCWV